MQCGAEASNHERIHEERTLKQRSMYKVVPWNPNRMQTLNLLLSMQVCPSRNVKHHLWSIPNGRNLKTKTPNG